MINDDVLHKSIINQSSIDITKKYRFHGRVKRLKENGELVVSYVECDMSSCRKVFIQNEKNEFKQISDT